MLNIRCKITITILLVSLNAFSQENLPYDENLHSYKQYFRDNYGVTISFPDKLKDLDIYFIPWRVRNDREKCTGLLYGPIFLSKDKNCMIAFPFEFISFFKGLEENKKIPLNTFYFDPKEQIAAEIETSLGLYYCIGDSRNKDIDNVELYNYVNFVFGKQAKEKYNADSFAIYDLPNANKTYFLDESLEKLHKKYPYCTSLFIQKDIRNSYLSIKFFFTEKGFKKKEKYIKMLDKHIWFDENFKPN
ncbi:hypothetical protein [Siansivirga zeaxanthinifaciens]|nr:hypothetical protein [Siansivirga zeaxanthinifaciens]